MLSISQPNEEAATSSPAYPVKHHLFPVLMWYLTQFFQTFHISKHNPNRQFKFPLKLCSSFLSHIFWNTTVAAPNPLLQHEIPYVNIGPFQCTAQTVILIDRRSMHAQQGNWNFNFASKEVISQLILPVFLIVKFIKFWPPTSISYHAELPKS